jgi:retron-type reverse transcriptase
MFTVDELFSMENQREALALLAEKKGGIGEDGISVSELEECWKSKETEIQEKIRNGEYRPETIKCSETVNKSGERQIVSNLASIDHLITTLLYQNMKRYIEPDFLPKSYACQDEKAALEAVMQAQSYLQKGNPVVVEIDIRNFMDEISLEKMQQILAEKIDDDKIVQLIRSYLYCSLSIWNQTVEKRKGLVRENPISPILSNLYLNQFDQNMEQKGYHWIRCAEHIYVFAENRENGTAIFNELSQKLLWDYQLPIDEQKSGVYDAMTRKILGYDFFKKREGIENLPEISASYSKVCF